MKDIEKENTLDSNSKNGKARVVISWINLILGGGTLAALIGWYFNYQDMKIAREQLRIQSEEHEQLKSDYESTRHPNLEISYFTDVGDQDPILQITNTGNAKADSIWITQNFYLVDSSGSVFECDLPRYLYTLFDGSEFNMFSLAEMQDTSIVFWHKCFFSFWPKLISKFEGELVTRWRIDYFGFNAPIRQTSYSYSLLDIFNRPISPSEKTGGFGLVVNVRRYERTGLPNAIRWVLEFNDYFLNPKQIRYEDDNSQEKLLPENSDSRKIKRVIVSALLEDSRPMSKVGYSAIDWQCDDEYLAKSLTMSRKLIY